jgi:hypothetical protein
LHVIADWSPKRNAGLMLMGGFQMVDGGLFPTSLAGNSESLVE